MRVAATSVLVTLVLLGTACANGEDDAAEPAATNDPAAEESAADTGAVAEVDPVDAQPAAEVELAMFNFVPPTVEVQAGDTVRWTNTDATRHTVTAGVDAEPTGAFHLTFDGRGDSAALQFTEPGEYRYFCTPHPFMQGTVTVTG
ncbi:MAG: plastocyanin/azurin family copper-binding protein [Egibacteraceae bacterium]